MTEAWLDSNVVLRFLTGEPPDQARRARRLMRRAADGDVLLRLAHVVLAEVVWVLGSFYERGPRTIAGTLRSFVLADGISVQEPDVVLEALRLMADANVAFVDAYVAAVAHQGGGSIASFDADLRRLGVELIDLAT